MLNLSIHTQPDDETCGPTSLHAVYKYYGMDTSLESVVSEVERSLYGGTLAPLLGNHALSKGFDVVIYINNLTIFDPTWFTNGKANPAMLYKKIETQMHYKLDPGLQQVSKAYLTYLSLGGQVYFKSLETQVLKLYFDQKVPIITGLNATYLYRCARELYEQGKAVFDDIRGTICGHFVVLCGYDEEQKHVIVADPHKENPLSHDNYYKVSSHRLINSIMLGVTTFDANLLIIRPKSDQEF
ncbi:C39 family peptidase [Legionella brunensis]|uniref:Guanylyl cyclase n=1 Tax=Legionella brunensis TaxID=29422 RepID=A0A0W0STN9_9GAMM|nr:C39 family peptidase [Legionella brunensis]KTC86573.1 Guanylyl cyclase [Legionella brunensis]